MIPRHKKNYNDFFPEDNGEFIRWIKKNKIKDWFTFRESYEICYPNDKFKFRIFLN